jgi:FkbM family methyltransferase
MQIEISEQAKLGASLINNVGIAAAAEGGDALHAGIAMLRRAVALNPTDLSHRLNLARFLLETDSEDEVESLCTFVLKHEQKSPMAWQIMGVVNSNRGRLDDAIACFKRAYELAPQEGQAKFDLAAAYMRAGDFANGLPLYEARGEILPKTGQPPNAPTWRGEKTGHLAIWPDQGYGDLIMFARFVPWAKERADKVSLIVQSHLLPLFQGYSAIADVKAVYNVNDNFDHQICIASLPLVYGLTTQNIPPDPGLLRPAETTNRIVDRRLKIGIAWQGNSRFPHDSMRSIPFRELLPLAADPRNTVISLQVGAASAAIAKARASRIVRDMSAEIEGEWAHTAALIKNLDLVVSSCTAVPHLAGALGVPTFIMIPRFADWRWFHGREDTPWYPNTRLFRQTRVGDWKSVMDRILKAIEEMHRRHDLVAILNRKIEVQSAPYEPDVTKLIERVLRPGDTFIDVGANVGKHTVPAAGIVGPKGRVIAIEPGENALPQLREVTKALPQVEIIDRPAWSHQMDVTFWVNQDTADGNAMWDPAEWPFDDNPKSKENPRPLTMHAVTLDGLINQEQGHFMSPRLIKIDVEGAEQRVLEGAAKLLERDHPPFIVAEFHRFGLEKLGCSQQSLRTFMENYGYSTFTLAADGSLPMLVPPGTAIKTQYIPNLLFSTPNNVGSVWGETNIQFANLRPMFAYGRPPEAKASAA